MREVNLPAKVLGLVLEAFNRIQGDRPVMLSTRLGKIVVQAQEMNEKFLERVKPYIEVSEGGKGVLREDLSDEEQAKVDEIFNEELTLRIPKVGLSELGEAGLTVPDDAVLIFLLEQGLLVDDS